MLKLGYSTGAIGTKLSLKERLKLIWEIEKFAVELGFTRSERLENAIDNESLQLIKQFEYISIHAPVKKTVNPKTREGTAIRYPSKEADHIIEKIVHILKITSAQTVVFHPDLVDDFGWLNKIFKAKLAFENMDAKKEFGKTTKDLRQVFKKAPEAKWVFDLNHLYTVDPTMKLADRFYEAFKNRLCHYHLSGYGGFHNCLCLTKENIILEGIKEYSVPIIHEGSATREGKDLLIRENNYILSFFRDKLSIELGRLQESAD
jgi:hypothetical protein